MVLYLGSLFSSTPAPYLVASYLGPLGREEFDKTLVGAWAGGTQYGVNLVL